MQLSPSRPCVSPRASTSAIAAAVLAAAAPASRGLADEQPAQRPSAAAQPVPEVSDGREWPGLPDSRPIWDWERATGDWAGLRGDLDDAGLTFGAEYIAEWSGVLDGGVSRSGSFRNLLTADLTFDTEALIGLPGGTAFFQYLHVNAERGGSLDAGDLQVYSNIENDRSLDVIYELWYEQLLLDDRLRIKVGKVDANSEFDFVDVAGDFSNSSAGFSPTILAFPSYPDPAMSVNVFGALVDSDGIDITLGYGFYDGAASDGVATGRRGPSTFFSGDLSDAYFHVGQVELGWDDLFPDAGVMKDGRLTLGGWYHTGTFEKFGGGTEDGTAGFFATGEVRVFDPDHGPDVGTPETALQATGRAGGDAPPRGLYVFAQYGWADRSVSEVAQHIAGGVVWRGPWAGRSGDSLGVYASLADLSDASGAGFDGDETAIDAYYRVQLTPAAFVQPELQYVVNPSGDSRADDAFIGSVRVGVAF
ncbi:MAG: carbohydrate porin [Planctomycetota bacterium]